ncbi:MAG TPA: ABC transporter ATP-binding protein [Actinomycetota bacterium]|jgi:branched-chain amino acid transport system ATP-binding protein|nr:ABC transporter ATP-binding protein [Actinomycetota bacterium]
MALLSCTGVSISFGGLRALSDAALDVGEWEVVGLIGPNGAGKTTLFNCIAGFYRPDSGRIEFRNRDVTEMPTHQRTAMGMGRTFQQVGLVRSLSVRDNLVLAQHPKVAYSIAAGLVALPGALREERILRENADEILAFLGLREIGSAPVSGLPYGTLKLVEVGLALATDPVLLLLDEPTSGMGPEESRGLGEIILRIRDELGITVFLIEHHVPLVTQVCDQVYVLNFGEMLAHGTPSEVQRNREVISTYLGEAV